jgi:hypothetical protein
LNTQETQGRALVFLAVLLSHVLVVLLAVRASRIPISLHDSGDEPLLIMELHDRVPPNTESLKSRARAHAQVMPRRGGTDNGISPTETPRQAEPPPPRIDWEQEAESAAQNEVSRTEKDKTYRDLSALSAVQLQWLRENHKEPAPPGIQWKHPRVEIQNGFPIIWINDRCVFIPWMMFAVFCGVGHIEPNGDLFKHMRDPHEP